LFCKHRVDVELIQIVVQNLNDGLGSSGVNDCCNFCTVFLEDLQTFWVLRTQTQARLVRAKNPTLGRI
jgi:hypothetical protein